MDSVPIRSDILIMKLAGGRKGPSNSATMLKRLRRFPAPPVQLPARPTVVGALSFC
jgi:hypothetical protein